jgi:cysteinyl-tRNA synthetase
MGYPGWHIECSAMSEKYLGIPFDIHTGGVDHVPTHHENEIAQSEAKTGMRTVNIWMHGEFMLVDDRKMSKSIGNTYTLDDLHARGFDPIDFRYFCLNAHYRQKLNFTFEGMSAARTELNRLREQVAQHREGGEEIEEAVLGGYKQSDLNAVFDDINIPSALGILWKLVKEKKSGRIYDLILYMDRVFGLCLQQPVPQERNNAATEVPDMIQSLLAARSSARMIKDFASSDRIRDEIAKLGYRVLDTKDGQVIEKI